MKTRTQMFYPECMGMSSLENSYSVPYVYIKFRLYLHHKALTLTQTAPTYFGYEFSRTNPRSSREGRLRDSDYVFLLNHDILEFYPPMELLCSRLLNVDFISSPENNAFLSLQLYEKFLELKRAGQFEKTLKSLHETN